MAAAGLTHGGFYKHFESKDQLVGEAFRHMMRGSAETLAGPERPGSPRERLRNFVDGYLSAEHRDHPGTGCGFAALGPEIARLDGAARAAATEGFGAMARIFAEADPAFRGAEGDARAHAAVATMIGALICARAVGDKELSDAILTDARLSVLAQLAVEPPAG
jgi:TetR/AcrR family transcriptional repressor of nem operon